MSLLTELGFGLGVVLQLCRAAGAVRWFAAKSDAEAIALQTLRDYHAARNFAKRLDCGAFTAAVRRRQSE